MTDNALDQAMDRLGARIAELEQERDAAIAEAARLQAIVTSEALERYPPR